MAAPDQSTESSSTGLGSEPDIIERYEEERPTASHALAEESTQIEPEEEGASQVQHDDVEVKNLGWNGEARHIPQPVVGGLTNEELWTLIRRFNKQVFQVRSIQEVPLADLDMNIADEDAFSPDKLRAQMERLYMSVLVSLMSLWKHVARLRSWRERERTSVFLAVYTVAWLLDLVIPTIIASAMVLVVYPPARDQCFPPVPPAIVDSRTGGVQKPAAGVLASGDSLTGAPEKHESEGVEQEAHSLVNSIATIVVSTTAGKHPQGDPHDDNTAPDPTQLADIVSSAKERTDGGEPNEEHDRTRKPVSDVVWSKAGPTMRIISDLNDTWERFGNALSPRPPFPSRRPRLRLACFLFSMLILSCFVTSYVMIKGLGFAVGFGFFGDPVLTPALELIGKTYPRWQRFVELRHTILRGVPTNAQLTITLLRIGERNEAPLPPPPSSDAPPAVETDTEAAKQVENLGTDRGMSTNRAFRSGSHSSAGVSDEEAREALEPEEPEREEEDASDNDQRKPKRSRRILSLLRGTAKGGVQTALTADKAKAAAGGVHARNRLGVVNEKRSYTAAGPVCFPARYGGKKGRVYVTSTATTPAVSWAADVEDVNSAWTVAMEDIDELKKVGGLGWKSKILVGWAMEREVVDGLVVRTREDREYHLTAIMTRDELFNRLIAMGNQMWETC